MFHLLFWKIYSRLPCNLVIHESSQIAKFGTLSPLIHAQPLLHDTGNPRYRQVGRRRFGSVLELLTGDEQLERVP